MMELERHFLMKHGQKLSYHNSISTNTHRSDLFTGKHPLDYLKYD